MEEEMAIHSSILTWKIPWTEKPCRLQSMGCKESDTIEWLSMDTRIQGKEAEKGISLTLLPLNYPPRLWSDLTLKQTPSDSLPLPTSVLPESAPLARHLCRNKVRHVIGHCPCECLVFPKRAWPAMGRKGHVSSLLSANRKELLTG